MNTRLRALIFLGTLALALSAMALLGMRSGGRAELQKYKAQLRAKGEKLTIAELTQGESPNLVDSRKAITNAVAKLKTAGFDPGVFDLWNCPKPGERLVNWKQTNPVWSEPRAVGRETWEALEKEIQGATNTLQEIRDALKSPAHHGGPYIPFWSSERRINFVAIRTAAQALAAATENDLHQGRLEAGLQNIEAIAGLARMEDRDYTLVAQMIRIAVAGMGLSVTWDALQAPGWTEPQLARLQKAWEGIDLVDALEIGLVGARAEGEGMFAEIRKAKRSQVTQWFRTNTIGKPGLKQRLEEIFVFPWYKLTSIDRDEILYLDYMQSSIEQARVLKAHRSWAEAKAESRKVLTKLVELSQGLSQYQHCVSLMAIPNFVRACQQGSHTETERQMTLAAIALKRFALRHGKLPPDLKTLVPELLTNVPFDYMGAKTMAYQPNTNGGYLLYSVGEDEKDDGGDPTCLGKPPATLWNGRDAVWPTAAGETNGSGK